MEVKVERSVFAEEAGWVARILSSKPTNVALQGVMVTAEGGTLRLSGSSGEASSEATIDAVVGQEGTIVVPGRLLAEVAKSLPGSDVHLSLDEDINRLLVASGRSKFKFPIIPLETYPKLPDQPESLGTIPGDLLTAAITQVSFAAAKDDTLPVLSAVLVQFGDGWVTFVATDKYRLCVKKVPWMGTRTAEVRLRAKTLDGLVRPAYPGPVELSLDETSSLFGITAGNRRSVMPVVDGEPLAWQRIIPTTRTLTVDFDVAELSEATKRVRLVADKPSIPLRAQFTEEGEMLITAGGSGTDAGVSEVVPCVVDGTVLSTAFDTNYLSEALSALTGETARMRFTEQKKPTLMEIVGDDTYLHLLMPIRSVS